MKKVEHLSFLTITSDFLFSSSFLVLEDDGEVIAEEEGGVGGGADDRGVGVGGKKQTILPHNLQ